MTFQKPTDLKRKLKDTETCVRYILAHYPETRNNDKLLMLTYWRIIDRIPVPPEFHKAFLHYATTPETITRARRLIQSQGDYQARDEVKEMRRRRQRKMRELLSGQKTLI